MKFTTVIDATPDVSIWGLLENVEVEAVYFRIEWEVQIEAREWGIKDFLPVVTNVIGMYDIETCDDKGDVISEETVQFDFEPYRKNCKFTAEFTEYRQLYISQLEINLADKSLEVS